MLRVRTIVIAISCCLAAVVAGLLYGDNDAKETDVFDQILNREFGYTKAKPVFFDLKGQTDITADNTGLTDIVWRSFLNEEETDYLNVTMRIKKFYTKEYGKPIICTIDKALDEVERYEWKIQQDNSTIRLGLYQHPEGYTPVGNMEIALYKHYPNE